MLSSKRRIQLAAPPEANPLVESANKKSTGADTTSTLGKRQADNDANRLSPAPGSIVKRRIVGAAKPYPTTWRTSEITSCASGCLRGSPDHVGLCITADGPIPPSIKQVWRHAKEWDSRDVDVVSWQNGESTTSGSSPGRDVGDGA